MYHPHSKIDDLPPLREVIDQYDLRAKKSLGQNFLLDQNITDRIVKSAGDIKQGTTIEIGPGPGGLTRSILRAGAPKVIAIEFDPRAIEALSSLIDSSEGRLRVIHGDALNTNILELSPDKPRRIIANLPYNIATPLLTGWLEQIHKNANTFESMTLMFQKEVGDRILAPHGNKTYGRLSIISQWLCHVKKAYDLPPQAFVPPPKIHSSVIHFKPRELSAQNKPDFRIMEKLTEAAFGQRRKMIRASLKRHIQYIEEIGIDPTLRAEQLQVGEFIALANKIQAGQQ